MTRYLITAWCERTFSARCEVDAETPQETLAEEREAIQDEPAEECDDGYPWDEWRVDTAETDGVLLQLDGRARLHAAADNLLLACRMVVDRWEHGNLAEASRACRAAVAEATGAAPTEPREPVVIAVRGGVVRAVNNVPPGYEGVVRNDNGPGAVKDAEPPKRGL